jgi:H+-translocating NAD(P) transhydrogenase subunit alpha
VTLGLRAEGAGGYAREMSGEELAGQQRALAAEVAKSDVVITTAAVPGRKAPILVTTAMVEGMAPGAVVVDMAADSGGNCEATVPAETVTVSGTLVVGMHNPASDMPTHASALYARNVLNVLTLFGDEPDFDDEIVKGMCVLRQGKPQEGS